MLIIASNAQREEIGTLMLGGMGMTAPPSTICGSNRMITIKGAEFAFGARAEANNPSIMPAKVTSTMVP